MFARACSKHLHLQTHSTSEQPYQVGLYQHPPFRDKERDTLRGQ